MLAVVLGCGFVFLSVCLHIYYWCKWNKMQSAKRISATCKVIICRTFAIIAFILALITLNGNIYLYAIFAVSFMLLIYDVFRLKWQIDKTLK